VIRPRADVGLRTSVVVAFAVGALVLSSALALGTYFSARHYLVEQRERTALRQAYTDAALVRDNLLTSGAQVSEVLGTIAQPAGTTVIVERGGRRYSSSLDPEGEDATGPFRDAVLDGSVVVGWSDATTPHSVVVGVPLPEVDALYYEVAVAEELDATLTTLQVALAICAALTTIGGALLGRAASRRVLAPLDQVTTVAVRVSAGDLDARLPATSDPDLAALVGAFNHMVEALHERIEHDARFAADVSHELRTPVTTLTTSLSLLQSSQGLPPASREAVDLMAAELDRFTRALRDLLLLGRLDAAVADSDPVTIPIGDAVTQALRACDKSPDLLVADEATRTLVTVVRPTLVGALVNLIANADMHGGGLTRVRVVGRGRCVDVLVEDEGPGVAEADRERVFERFARAGGRKPGSGSGLGLSIVERGVRNQGGSVWCTSGRDAGACFVVRLPVAEEAPA
jgi:signal transduction histidine kinase